MKFADSNVASLKRNIKLAAGSITLSISDTLSWEAFILFCWHVHSKTFNRHFHSKCFFYWKWQTLSFEIEISQFSKFVTDQCEQIRIKKEQQLLEVHRISCSFFSRKLVLGVLFNLTKNKGILNFHYKF